MILFIITIILVTISYVMDKKKTKRGVQKALNMFLGILPALLNILIIVSLIMTLITKDKIALVLGQDSCLLIMLNTSKSRVYHILHTEPEWCS